MFFGTIAPKFHFNVIPNVILLKSTKLEIQIGNCLLHLSALESRHAAVGSSSRTVEVNVFYYIQRSTVL